jgi:hypothetical protein
LSAAARTLAPESEFLLFALSSEAQRVLRETEVFAADFSYTDRLMAFIAISGAPKATAAGK